MSRESVCRPSKESAPVSAWRGQCEPCRHEGTMVYVYVLELQAEARGLDSLRALGSGKTSGCSSGNMELRVASHTSSLCVTQRIKCDTVCPRAWDWTTALSFTSSAALGRLLALSVPRSPSDRDGMTVKRCSGSKPCALSHR